MSAVIKLCAAVVQQQVGRDDAEAESWRMFAFAAREEYDQLRRATATARAEVERLQERVATQDDGLRYGEQVCARLVSERDKLRAERRQLRARLVECLPFVGVCPLEPNRIQLMRLVRDLADDTLEEVKP